jgi:hypothetical protein
MAGAAVSPLQWLAIGLLALLVTGGAWLAFNLLIFWLTLD